MEVRLCLLVQLKRANFATITPSSQTSLTPATSHQHTITNLLYFPTTSQPLPHHLTNHRQQAALDRKAQYASSAKGVRENVKQRFAHVDGDIEKAERELERLTGVFPGCLDKGVINVLCTIHHVRY